VKNEGGSETSVSFTAENSNGLPGRFEISQAKPGYRMPEFGLSIECSKGKIEVNDDRLCTTLNNDNVQNKMYRHDLNDGVDFSIGDPEYFRENIEFVNSLLINQQCKLNFDDASIVDYVIDQVRGRSGQ
jgi:predicted dehydrogenase